MVFGLILPTNNNKVSVCVWICCCKYILTFFDYIFHFIFNFNICTQLSWFLFSRRSVLSRQQFSTNAINLNMIIREPVNHQSYLKTTLSCPVLRSNLVVGSSMHTWYSCVAKSLCFEIVSVSFSYFRLYYFSNVYLNAN